mgnify:CR=1 FL=1
MIIDFCTTVEVTSVIVQSMSTYPSAERAVAALSHGWFLTTVLYGYSPGPKKRIFIPVNTSNSVFAVPAPTDGTLKYPEE